MKLIRQLSRYIRDGFKNIWSHLFMSLSSVVTLTITLSLCALFILFAENTNQLTRQVESEVKVFVELDLELEESEIDAVISEIEGKEYVESIAHNTPDEGFDEVVDRMAGGNPDTAAVLRDSMDETVLPHTLTIEADSVDNVADARDLIYEIDGVQYASFGVESDLAVFINITSTIRNVMLIIVVVLMILAVFLIQNTIKLTIYARQEELKIMKLVGASMSHVTVPFIVEGVIIGILGSFIPILLTVLGYNRVYGMFDGSLFVQMLQLASPFPLVYMIGFAMGIVSIGVSLLGSLFAVSKYSLKA